MANKFIEITLRAKNAMAAGLSSAKESLQKVGKTAMNVGKIIATGFLAGTTALVGFAAKALQAYSKQEEAERKLTSALNAHGEAGEALLPMYRRIASEIQDATGVADELTLASMAQGRTLGVATKDLEEYAKGVVALKSAGLEGATAQRAMAAAMQGNTEMLTRYLPELRGVTDEQEKQRIVSEFLEKGYQQQADQLNTVGGQWAALKGRIGDVWEEIGRAIAQNGALVDVLKRAGDAVKAFGERITKWMGSGGIGRLKAGVQEFFLDMRQRWEMARADAGLFFAAVRDNTVFKYLTNAIVAFGNVYKEWFFYIRDLSIAVFKVIRSLGREAFEPPDFNNIVQAYRNFGEAVRGQNIETTNHLEQSIKKRDELQQKHAQEAQDLQDKTTAQLKEEFDERQKAEREAAAAELELAERKDEDIVDSAEKTTDAIKAEHDKRVADAKAAHNAEQKAAEDAQRKQIKDAEKALAAQQKLAGMRVADFIAEQQKDRDEEKDRAREAQRMQRLKEAKGRGIKLSRGQQERLDAFRQIQQAADQGVADAERELQMHQNALEQLQADGNQKLDNMLVELKKNHKAQLKLLQFD